MKDRHNDFDAACKNWWGDRNNSPRAWFGGQRLTVIEERCLVCRPFAETEGLELLGY